MPTQFSKLVLSTALLAVAAPLFAQTPAPKPEDTEVWEPVPKVVTPGPINTGAPPSDAIILFDGKNLDEWVANKDKSPAAWNVADGVMTVAKSTGNIEDQALFHKLPTPY